MSNPVRDYEIREYEASDLGPLYVVWDLKNDKRVPFSNYRTRDQAENRIARRRNRDSA